MLIGTRSGGGVSGNPLQRMSAGLQGHRSDELAAYFTRCDREVQLLRLAACSARLDLGAPALASTVEKVASVYSGIVRFLREDPLAIVSTGGVEGRMRDLNYALRSVLVRHRREGKTPAVQEEVQNLENSFAAIIQSVGEKLESMQRGDAEERAVRLSALVRSLGGEKFREEAV